MNIFLINFIVMLFEAWVLLYAPLKKMDISEEKIQEYKKKFVILQCIQWILISTLRSDAVGADTSNYSGIFDAHSEFSWRQCLEYFRTVYVKGEMTTEVEPGFVLFEKIISSIWHNQIFYKFSIAAIFMSSLGRFVYRNSDDPFIAFLLYSGLFYNMFSLTGYRQVLSVSIGILWAYESVKERKFLKFLALVLLSSTIHKTTLVFITFYFLSKKKITGLYGFFSTLIIMAMIVFRYQLFEFVKVFAGYDEYDFYKDSFTQRNFIILFIALSILIIWRHRHVAKVCPDSKILYNGLILSAAMLPFAMVNPTSMRLVYDFGFILMILVPKVYHSFAGNRDRAIAYGSTILVFGYFIATKSVPYEFFWQMA